MTLIDKAEALLPCPFCGGKARKWQDPSHSAAWFIGCDDGDRDCFGSIHWAETETEAIAAWNRRALPARGVGVNAATVKDAVMGWVWAEDSDVSKRLGPKHTEALIARILAALAPTDYTLAPHLQKIVDGAKTAPQWDMQADRLAPTDAPDPAPHVNETQNSEHDAGNMLTAAQAPAEDAHVKGETAGQMLERLGMDGVKWAAEFRTTALRLGYSDMDEGWLIGWFCNAIMAGYDRSAAQAREAAEALVNEHLRETRADEADATKFPVRIGHVRALAAALAAYRGEKP